VFLRAVRLNVVHLLGNFVFYALDGGEARQALLLIHMQLLSQELVELRLDLQVALGLSLLHGGLLLHKGLLLEHHLIGLLLNLLNHALSFFVLPPCFFNFVEVLRFELHKVIWVLLERRVLV